MKNAPYIITFFVFFLFSRIGMATEVTVTLPATAGNVLYSDSSSRSSDGYCTVGSSGEIEGYEKTNALGKYTCRLYFSINDPAYPVPSSIKSLTLYYYDESDSDDGYISASLIKGSFTGSSSTTLDSDYLNSTNFDTDGTYGSVSTMVLAYSSTLSGYLPYYLSVQLGNGTQLRSVVIVYEH